LFRNQGGSFGIAFVTTMIERRTQFHRTILVTHISNYDLGLQSALANITANLVQHGYSAADAATRAIAQIDGIVQRQAAMYGFIDCFWLLGVVAFVGPVLALFIRKFDQEGGGGAAH
jgi:DHA2 family multidrug resistance protein